MDGKKHLLAAFIDRNKYVKYPAVFAVEVKHGDSAKKIVALQWFGETEEENNFGLLQFYFPLPLLINSTTQTLLNGELEKVIFSKEALLSWGVLFIGQIKDWPYQEEIKEIAGNVAEGDEEKWIVCCRIPITRAINNNLSGPLTIAFPVIIPHHSHFGLITPRPYIVRRFFQEETKETEESGAFNNHHPFLH